MINAINSAQPRIQSHYSKAQKSDVSFTATRPSHITKAIRDCNIGIVVGGIMTLLGAAGAIYESSLNNIGGAVGSGIVAVIGAVAALYAFVARGVHMNTYTNVQN